MPTKRPRQAPAVIRARLEACRQAMRRAKIGAYLVTCHADQVYLTGFDGEDGACVITPRSVHIVTDGRFDQTFDRQAPWADKHMRKNGLFPAVADCLKQARVRKVGFQAEHLAAGALAALRNKVRTITLVAAPRITGELRVCKDAQELRRIRVAIDIAESAFKALRRQLKVGMTETEIAARLEYEMKKRGSARPSFDTIVAEGPNAALPHASPGKRILRKGSLLLVDWGARVDHYCSDLTRMIFVDKISARFKLLYEIVLEAQMQAIAAVAPGRRMCDIDQIARDHISDAGYGPQFTHGLGHGMGIDIHEAPSVRRGVTDLLKPGMVITIEPGIYLPGVGGIRIEDDVLVTSRGHEVLTTLNKTIRSAML